MFIENYLGTDFKAKYLAVFWTTLAIFQDCGIIRNLNRRPQLELKGDYFLVPDGMFTLGDKIILFDHVGWSKYDAPDMLHKAGEKCRKAWNCSVVSENVSAYIIIHYDPFVLTLEKWKKNIEENNWPEDEYPHKDIYVKAHNDQLKWFLKNKLRKSLCSDLLIEFATRCLRIRIDLGSIIWNKRYDIESLHQWQSESLWMYRHEDWEWDVSELSPRLNRFLEWKRADGNSSKN